MCKEGRVSGLNFRSLAHLDNGEGKKLLVPLMKVCIVYDQITWGHKFNPTFRDTFNVPHIYNILSDH